MVAGQEGGGGGECILRVEFTFNNQIIPHTCVIIMVSNNE